MCDTVVALPDTTADGALVFAKNSDREPSEAQALEWIAGGETAGRTVRCTHIEVPQVPRTRALLISRPYWMWGAEMGVSDAGVAIGNETVFTRAMLDEVALLGMDLNRLALERAATAREALDTITSLIAEHGQGGEAGHVKSFRYSSSFLLADSEEAWVLETAGRAWVAARARGIRSISNGLTLRDDWELCSDGLSARARDYGLRPNEGKLDFRRTFMEPLFTWGAAARKRRSCTESFLGKSRGQIGPSHAMAALRQHGAQDRFRPGAMFMTVCGHASWPPTRNASQTTGSLVVHITKGGATAFATGTAAPCASSFKPVWVDAPTDALGATPTRRYDPESLWWSHERLHRRALGDFSTFSRGFPAERDRLEASWLEQARAAEGERRATSERAFREGRELEERWIRRLGAERKLPGRWYRKYWERLDRDSGLWDADKRP